MPSVIDVLPVPAPTMGIIGNVPSTMLDPRACVNCNNVVFKDGIVSPRTGSVAYGSGTITGVLLAFFRYQTWNGREYEMLVTTTNVYHNLYGTWTSIADSLKGDINARATLAYIQNYLVFSNGIDAPAKWDGSSWAALTDGAGTNWGTYRPLIFLPFRFRLLGFNDNKPSTGAGIRIMYSKTGEYDDIDGVSDSGYIDFTQGVGSRIVGAAPLKNYIGMYKDGCCALLSYIGGSSIFAINVQIHNLGLAAKDAIAVVQDSHIFLGSDLNIYRWNGGTIPEPIGNPIKKLLQAEINKAAVGRSFAIVNREQKQVIFFVPINNDEYPTRMWILEFDEDNNPIWSKGTIPAISAGNSLKIGGVEKTLLGTGRQAAGTGEDYWDNVYEAGVVPGSDGWTLFGGDYGTVSGGILTINTTASLAYLTSYMKYPGVNFAGGFTIKFRAQVIASTGDYPFTVAACDMVNVRNLQIHLRTDSIYSHAAGDKICDFDTTDAYHVYRLYMEGSVAKLYIDDVLKGTWTMPQAGGGDYITFEDVALTSSINIKIDYFYYGFGDLDEPTLGASAIKHYDYEALDDDGVAIENDFETGDFVIDKVEHLIKNRRFFGLKLDLKGYSTDSKFSIQYSLDEGVLYTTAVEKSLIAAYSLIGYDFTKTTRKIRFKFSDDTLSQKWWLRFYGIKQKERERK